MNYKKLTNITVEGLEGSDYPDFANAYISGAEYNGKELTDDQLDEVNENSLFVHDCAINQLF